MRSLLCAASLSDIMMPLQQSGKVLDISRGNCSYDQAKSDTSPGISSCSDYFDYLVVVNQ